MIKFANNYLRMILVLLIVIGGLLTAKTYYLLNKIELLEQIIMDDNQILGSIFDTRSDSSIEQDTLKGQQEKIFSFIEWQATPAELDLVGWDDHTLPSKLADVSDEFSEFVISLKQLFPNGVAISYRQKKLSSLIGKLKERNRKLEALTLRRVADIGGARLVFGCRQDIAAAVVKAKSTYKIVSEEDYYSRPKPRGYRSYHITINYKDLLVEIQLRTIGVEIWSIWDHDLLYKNNQTIIDLVGPKKLDEFNSYSKQFIDYVAQVEEGRLAETFPPLPPKGITLLWELASDEVKKIMTPEGIPNLSLLEKKSCESK